VSLSPILSINEIVKQHIRNKTHKPIVLRFWVEGGIIHLCGFRLIFSLFEISPVFPLFLTEDSSVSRMSVYKSSPTLSRDEIVEQHIRKKIHKPCISVYKSSPTLSRNEIVEQHIRKKIHKPNVLRFWVEVSVISLCGVTHFLILICLPKVFSLGLLPSQTNL